MRAPWLRLKLKASLSWADIKQRLDREFDPDDVLRNDLYDAWHALASQQRVRALGTNMIVHHPEDFTCSGDDGLAPAGLVLNCLCACPAARPSLVQASCENR